MADITLDIETMQHMAMFERSCGVAPVDCLMTTMAAFFVVPEGAYRRIRASRDVQARLDRFSKRLGRRLEVVERSRDAETFVRGLFRPYGLEEITIESGPDGARARVSVDSRRKGLAIGKGGSNLNALRELARRHAGIQHIVLE